jgi:hypothetical protein
MGRWPVYRDVILFVCGLAGVAHETLVSNVDRPWLLAIFGAMMGLPAFLQLDKRSDKDGK